MEKITLQELVATNNTPKAKSLLAKYGYEPAQNYDDLVYKLFRLTKEYKEEALKDLSDIHPHRDLILNYTEKEECDCEKKVNNILSRFVNKKKYSNFEYADEYIDFNGKSSAKESTESKMKEYLPLLVIAGIFAITLTTISKK
jgi:hypothetical protein